mgnify:CR=1 FL=1
MPVYSELATEAVGLLTLTADDAGLSGVWLEAHRHAPTTRAGWVRDDDRLADAAGQLREYLTGDRRCFDLPRGLWTIQIAQKKCGAAHCDLAYQLRIKGLNRLPRIIDEDRLYTANR